MSSSASPFNASPRMLVKLAMQYAITGRIFIHKCWHHLPVWLNCCWCRWPLENTDDQRSHYKEYFDAEDGPLPITEIGHEDPFRQGFESAVARVARVGPGASHLPIVITPANTAGIVASLDANMGSDGLQVLTRVPEQSESGDVEMTEPTVPKQVPKKLKRNGPADPR